MAIRPLWWTVGNTTYILLPDRVLVCPRGSSTIRVEEDSWRS